jgi:hypothetical protein
MNDLLKETGNTKNTNVENFAAKPLYGMAKTS